MKQELLVAEALMKTEKICERIKNYLCEQFNLPEEQVVTMLPEFKKTIASHMENLQQVDPIENLDGLKKSAHTIKGAFLNLGLMDCAELAVTIENGAAKRDTSINYASLIKDMSEKVKEFK